MSVLYLLFWSGFMPAEFTLAGALLVQWKTLKMRASPPPETSQLSKHTLALQSHCPGLFEFVIFVHYKFHSRRDSGKEDTLTIKKEFDNYNTTNIVEKLPTIL